MSHRDTPITQQDTGTLTHTQPEITHHPITDLTETGTETGTGTHTTANSTHTDDYPSPTYAWYMVGLLLLVYIFSFIDRQILGLLGPAIMADFQISDQQFGLLTGFAFALFYATFGLFCARIADTRSRKWLIAVGLFLWSLMTAASGLARTYGQLFIMRMGVGVGEAALAPAANSLLADSFPKEKLSTALSVYSMGIPIGSGLAFIVGGAVISLSGSLPEITVPGIGTLASWQKALMLVGIPGLLLTLLVTALKEPSRKGRMTGKAKVSVREVADFMKRHKRAYAGIMLGVSLNAALGFGMMIWLTHFMVRSHGIAPSEVGLTFGIIALITGPVGLLVAGRLADFWASKGMKDAHLKVLMIAPIGFAVPATAFPLVGDITTSWVLIAVANLFLSSPSGVAFASLQVITPNEMRGQVISVYVLCANIIGYAGGSYVLGLLSDMLRGTYGDQSLAISLSVTAALLSPCCLGLYLWGRRAFMKAYSDEDMRLEKLKAST